jgi:hypothetical protein
MSNKSSILNKLYMFVRAIGITIVIFFVGVYVGYVFLTEWLKGKRNVDL